MHLLKMALKRFVIVAVNFHGIILNLIKIFFDRLLTFIKLPIYIASLSDEKHLIISYFVFGGKYGIKIKAL